VKLFGSWSGVALLAGKAFLETVWEAVVSIVEQPSSQPLVSD
jgi:hypothetical protein